MDRYAIILNGVVSNVILWDGIATYVPPGGSTVLKLAEGQAVGPGFSYDGTAFTAPPEPPPAADPAE
jgi:hypothetical protein